jgi:hypothetical protein
MPPRVQHSVNNSVPTKSDSELRRSHFSCLRDCQRGRTGRYSLVDSVVSERVTERGVTIVLCDRQSRSEGEGVENDLRRLPKGGGFCQALPATRASVGQLVSMPPSHCHRRGTCSGMSYLINTAGCSVLSRDHRCETNLLLITFSARNHIFPKLLQPRKALCFSPALQPVPELQRRFPCSLELYLPI